jgi:hypothetical protein
VAKAQQAGLVIAFTTRVLKGDFSAFAVSPATRSTFALACYFGANRPGLYI